jgi:hypothetical protein
MRTKPTLTLALAAMLSLSGCAIADQIPDTASMKPFGNGADTRIGELLVQDNTVVLFEDGTAALTSTVVSQSDVADSLISVSINNSAADLDATRLVPAGGIYRIGYNSEHFAQTAVYGVEVGEYVPVTYSFQNAGDVTVNVLVVAPIGEYAMVTPRPIVAE